MTVAVVIPVRNGAHLLAGCVAAVRGQSRPPDEVLIVVGPSQDDTRDVALRIANGLVRVHDNRAGDRASAINLALELTDCDLIALVDAQARIGPGYVAAAERVLADPTIAVAGGPMRPEASSAVGRAMAAALQSPFGVGNSQFHFEGMARDVESVYLGVYRRDAYARIGRYNAGLHRTEDDDLNARIRAAGLRIRLDPSIRSTYRCRERIQEIWRQYFGYGYWKVALAAVRPAAIRIRHAIPAAFVIALASALTLGVVGLWLPLAAIVSVWTGAALAFAAMAPATSWVARLLFPIVALTMHLAYGIGTIIGVASWPRLAERVRTSHDPDPITPHNSDHDLATICATYERYRREGRDQIWNPRNAGFGRIVRDRDRALIALLRASLPPNGGRVLDLGAGEGRLATVARDAGVPVARWTGVDLDPAAMAVASKSIPWATWVEASADGLPFPDGSFDIVVAATLFSSLPSTSLERAAAAEVARVLHAGGWLVWYDLRYYNPANPAVHGIGRSRLAELFPGWPIEVRSMTLLPPLARRLGPLTPLLYRPLELLPPLRSHLVGRLRRPAEPLTNR